MKLLMLLFSVFTLSSNIDVDSSFIEELNNSYDEYVLLEEYSNNYYDLQLYAGRVNDDIYYGIYFFNKIPQEYNLKLRINDKIYTLDKTPRGDIVAPAVNFKNAEDFSILIYNKNDYYQYGINRFQNIKSIDIEDFSILEHKVAGSGQGVQLAKLKSDLNIDKRLSIYIVLVSIFLVCGVIILVYYKKKKGMFNSDIKSANVFNFKEFINSAINTYEEEFEEYREDFDNSGFNNYDESTTESESLNEGIVTTTYKWHHYEEEKSDFDIKLHLESMGLPTNYQTATVEDKNLVMLELMRLRDQNKITQDDYLDEISELWKN